MNRGWVPVGVDRNKIPNLNFTKGGATIYGVLKKAPRTGILLADNQAEKLNENITRFQKIDTYELTRLIKLNKIKKFANNPFLYPIFPYVIRLSPESEHGYIRNWESRNSGENIHIGYAYQWFAFAATLFVIYLVLNIKRQEQRKLLEGEALNKHNLKSEVNKKNSLLTNLKKNCLVIFAGKTFDVYKPTIPFVVK